MLLKQKMLAVGMAVGLLIFIIETVRRRRLREEYAWLWVLIGVVILVLSLWQGLLRAITSLLGIELPINTVFFFGLMLVVFINLHFSVKISQLTDQVKRLTQELALKKEDPPERS
ncbi:MAG: DUF2304 domain-containing protein [Candidatus Euphemobacter frigidus]|nr:DUF2304 domain-containing protein [Candidatus Euphemobacter frigidus]MDP8275927.1 DUF2304 domain-containing protein [Candidatus Euphemobacter frigidus]